MLLLKSSVLDRRVCSKVNQSDPVPTVQQRLAVLVDGITLPLTRTVFVPSVHACLDDVP